MTHAFSPNDYPEAVLAEDILERVNVNDVRTEINGQPARFRTQHAGNRSNGTAVVFAADSVHTIRNWNLSDALADIDGVSVPKTLLDPAPPSAPGVRRYEVGLDGQRTAIARNQALLARRHPPAERTRLTNLLSRRQSIYNRMWMREMMYNRFDTDFATWTSHYNAQLSPSDALDPNIPKSIAFQESRMGTSGQHLLMPPYVWDGSGSHPIKSRFNIGQAIDSFGPQQWLMMREMAPEIARRNGLDALAARRVWMGMTSREYLDHPTFMDAVREFFTARNGANNLMGTRGKDLHLDYGFWVRTAIRWLFVKYQSRRDWPAAVRAYNGGGSRATAYRNAVMARVGSNTVYNAGEIFDDGPASDVAENGPTLSSGARLTWQNLTRIPNSRRDPTLFYVVTGAPTSVAAAGDESHAVFELKVENRNSVYNHLNVQTKARLLDILPGRRFRTAYPSSGRGWAVRSQPDLEDESSRVIKVRFPRSALERAYDSNHPPARVELEYHWREAMQSRQRQYARTGLDFMLVAPVEFMLSRRRRIGEIRFDDVRRHRSQFWLPVAGVNFSRALRGPLNVTLSVSSRLTSDRRRTTQQSQSQGQSRTSGSQTTTGMTMQTSVSMGNETSGSASIEIFELGVKNMMEAGFSQSFSRSVTRSRSSTNSTEFSRSIMLSQGYQTENAISTQARLDVTRPISPPTTGRSRPSPSSVGVYIYPIVDYYEVPYVRFSGVNRFGQATRRQQGMTVIPIVREWRLTDDLPR